MMTLQEAHRLGWEGKRAERFVAWRNEVDREIQKIARVSGDDIDDWGYASAFDDGVKPADAARYALEAAGFPFDDGDPIEESYLASDHPEEL